MANVIGKPECLEIFPQPRRSCRALVFIAFVCLIVFGFRQRIDNDAKAEQRHHECANDPGGRPKYHALGLIQWRAGALSEKAGLGAGGR